MALRERRKKLVGLWKWLEKWGKYVCNEIKSRRFYESGKAFGVGWWCSEDDCYSVSAIALVTLCLFIMPSQLLAFNTRREIPGEFHLRLRTFQALSPPSWLVLQNIFKDFSHNKLQLLCFTSDKAKKFLFLVFVWFFMARKKLKLQRKAEKINKAHKINSTSRVF